MVDIRQRIVQEAETWLGTPWIHHQGLRGVGVDCVHLLSEVATVVGIKHKPLGNYYQTPDRDAMLRLMKEQFLQISYIPDRLDIPGNLALFKFAGIPHHVAITVGKGEMIHASFAHRKVVRERFDTPDWQNRLVTGFNPLMTPSGDSNLKDWAKNII